MNVLQLLSISRTRFNLVVKDRNELFRIISDTLYMQGVLKSKAQFVEDLMKREKQVSTALAENIALPHAQSSNILKPVLGFFQLKNEIIWDDKGTKVKSVFVIAVPDRVKDKHLTILASLSKILINGDAVEKITKTMNYAGLIRVLKMYSLIKGGESIQSDQSVPPSSISDGKGYDVVGVACCPTGIAHTYMAAESLTKECERRGLTVKIETQGGDRILNKLTKEDIENAKCIILALDRGIQKDRFFGKRVLETSTGQSIKNSKKILDRALKGEGTIIRPKTATPNVLSGDLPPLEGSGEKLTFSKESIKKLARNGYLSLLSGVSYMIPFVVFGGIFIAISFLIDINNAGSLNYGSGTEAARWFKNLGVLGFNLFVPVLGAYIAYNVVGKGGLLPAFVTGFIATGNFFNKMDGNDKIGFFQEAVSPSGFLGAIIGGFIVIGVVLLLRKGLYKAPKALHGIFGVLVMPLLATLIAGTIMWLINIPLGLANKGITDGLKTIAVSGPAMIGLGLLIGSMMAFDMGGPVNKAAYVFGVFTLDQGGANGSVPMAQVMLGGMIPPLVVALSTTVTPKLWTAEDRSAGLTAWILGVSFITEGAIPFAAKRPKVIIPTIVVSSAIGAAVLGLFSIWGGVTLNAPAGGIFVFPLIRLGDSIPLGIAVYVGCLALGAIVGTIMIPLMRKITKTPIVVDPDAKNFIVQIYNRIKAPKAKVA